METFLYAADTLAVLGPHLDSIRAAGVTVIKNGYYPINDENEANNIAWLDACHAAGLRCIVDLRKYTSVVATRSAVNAAAQAALYDSHPAVYGWYTDDESDGTAYTIAERRTMYLAIKAVSDKPIMEVHYRVDPIAGKSAHYPTDGTIVHDIYGINNYLHINFAGNVSAWSTYIDGEYAKLTATDKANLTHILQAYGQTTGNVPPNDGIQNQQYPEVISPNNWLTWGLGYYTYPKFDHPEWIYATDSGYEYLLGDIAAANAAYLPTAAITVTGLVLTGSATTHTVSGTCAAGCLVIVDGTTWAIHDAAGTGWTAVVSPGSHQFVASNGLETASVTYDTGPAIPASAISGAEGTQLRVYDGSVKYIPLVATTESNASFARIFDGVDTWAMAEGASRVAPPDGFSGLDMSLQLTV